MKLAVFSTKPYDRAFLDAGNTAHGHEITYLEARLTPETAGLAAGHDAVCAFVNDDLSATTLESLAASGVRLVALRSAGFNHVDLAAAQRLGIAITRVPAYSPYAVAEHALGLILTLNRKFHRAFNRVREGNFSIDGLLGFDLHGRTVGVIGTGSIGLVFCRLLTGFGCRILAYDPDPAEEGRALGVEYTDLDTLLAQSEVISLHCPLTPETRHLIDATAIERMRPDVMIINTSRGALIDTPAVIAGLKSKRIGSLGLDVYEEEADLFFEDLSGTVLQDDVFARLLTFSNVLITAHQAFFTEEAMANIAATTLQNVSAYASGSGEIHLVPPQRPA